MERGRVHVLKSLVNKVILSFIAYPLLGSQFSVLSSQLFVLGSRFSVMSKHNSPCAALTCSHYKAFRFDAMRVT